MWLLLLMTLAEPTATGLPQSLAAPVGILGDFSNMEFTEEHAFGYTVQLWRQSDRVFGSFEVSEGLAGDTPIGKLEDVKFEPRSGAFSFKAKLTMGVAFPESGRQRPSRDLFEFRGNLERAALVGTLMRRDLLRPNATPVASQVRLQRRGNERMIQARTYAEWKKAADEILKFHGPKW